MISFARGLTREHVGSEAALYPITVYPPWLRHSGLVFTLGCPQRAHLLLGPVLLGNRGRDLRTYRSCVCTYVGKGILLGRVQRGVE